MTSIIHGHKIQNVFKLGAIKKSVRVHAHHLKGLK